MTIQITSMADIFTIILVFLLKSYATSSIQIQPSPGLKLPIADSADAQLEAIHVEVSERSVQIDHQPVAVLANFRFENSDLLNNGISQSIFSNSKEEATLDRPE
jgi:hypothetical protein